MNAYQEPKYKIEHGRLVNRQSGNAIPDDEPVFILRARDLKAADTLSYYWRRIQLDSSLSAKQHEQAIIIRLAQFQQWAKDHPDRMKEPDTNLTDLWKLTSPPVE